MRKLLIALGALTLLAGCTAQASISTTGNAVSSAPQSQAPAPVPLPQSIQAKQVSSVTSFSSSEPSLQCGIVNDPTGTPLNVRRYPNGEILGSLSNGDQVTVKETVRLDNKAWSHVIASSGEGYVFAAYINKCS
jgi:protein-disulfide isomerase